MAKRRTGWEDKIGGEGTRFKFTHTLARFTEGRKMKLIKGIVGTGAPSAIVRGDNRKSRNIVAGESGGQTLQVRAFSYVEAG